jgi:dolichol-phosphate mannosyltransferase
MRSPRRVIVVLPAFNEEGKIGALLDQLDEELTDAGLAYRVIVVDDGSMDRTASIVEERGSSLPITLQRHLRNQGLGATIRDALAAAAAEAADADVIVTMDADDTHGPGLILRMVRMIREGHDVVIASRYQPGSRVVGVPAGRRP